MPQTTNPRRPLPMGEGQPRQRRGRVRTFLLVGLLGVVLAACGPGGGSTASSVNTAAAALSLSITILDDQSQAANGPLTVGVKFATPITFTHGETFTCNGRPLTPDSSGAYDLRGSVPLATVGDAYTFVYTRGGVATTVRAPAPQRLSVSAPAAGATIPRSQSYVVQYTPTQDSASGIVAVDAADSATVSADAAPGDGVFTLSAYGLAKFHAGPGSLTLRQSFITSPQHSGFGSLAITYLSVVAVHVIWQ